MLKFGQEKVATKDFYGQRQIIDIFTINVNKVVVSDNVSCNDGKDYRYIVGYQVDGALMPLLIKTLKIYLVIVCHILIKVLPVQFHSMSPRKESGWLNSKRFGTRLSHIYLKNWVQN